MFVFAIKKIIINRYPADRKPFCSLNATKDYSYKSMVFLSMDFNEMKDLLIYRVQRINNAIRGYHRENIELLYKFILLRCNTHP